MGIHKFEIGFSGNSAKKMGLMVLPFLFLFADFYLKNHQICICQKNWHKQKEKKLFNLPFEQQFRFRASLLSYCGFRHRKKKATFVPPMQYVRDLDSPRSLIVVINAIMISTFLWWSTTWNNFPKIKKGIAKCLPPLFQPDFFPLKKITLNCVEYFESVYYVTKKSICIITNWWSDWICLDLILL